MLTVAMNKLIEISEKKSLRIGTINTIEQAVQYNGNLENKDNYTLFVSISFCIIIIYIVLLKNAFFINVCLKHVLNGFFRF